SSVSELGGQATASQRNSEQRHASTDRTAAHWLGFRSEVAEPAGGATRRADASPVGWVVCSRAWKEWLPVRRRAGCVAAASGRGLRRGGAGRGDSPAVGRSRSGRVRR